MAGGAGCEWFFQSDIHCEDWRSRDKMWEQTKVALDFFHQYLPFADMEPHDELVQGGDAWCLARPGEIYAVYSPKPAEMKLDLSRGKFQVEWYNPRTGAALVKGKTVKGGALRALGNPPTESDRDWVARVIRLVR